MGRRVDASGLVKELRGGEVVGLTSDEQVMLSTLLEEIQSLELAEGVSLDEADLPMLWRYLKAAQWRLEVGGKRVSTYIQDTFIWRKEMKVSKILSSPTDFIMKASTGQMFVRGKCKMGRPLIWFYLGRGNTVDPDQNLRFIIFNLERAVASFGAEDVESVRNNGQFCVVVDCSFEDGGGFPALATVRHALSMLALHYPSRLGSLFVLNAGTMITSVWWGLSFLIKQSTREKIFFLSGTEEEQQQALRQHIDPAELEKGNFRAFDPWIYLFG
ncbi:unnamed protein product [Discosporangium mesarthrocarpum]